MADLHKKSDVAVLFVLIGWAQRYDGTESIVGNHAYLQENPDSNGEMEAFASDSKGSFCCGIGDGNIVEPLLDVVFIAKNIATKGYEVVGLYSKVKITSNEKWRRAHTKHAILIPPGKRPIVQNYPIGTGMRRWAHRIVGKGVAHVQLYSVYKKLAKLQNWDTTTLSPDEIEISAFEGKLRKQFIIHRHREAKLRSAKIRDTLKRNAGILACEVPGCGFNFHQVYGLVGENFAVVHHRIPLAESSPSGRNTTINDLAVVCSNCHAMIHRGGECRSLDSLVILRK